MNSSDASTELMKVLDILVPYVSTATGMRQQFIDAGWSQRGAEEMVVTILRTSTGSS